MLMEQLPDNRMAAEICILPFVMLMYSGVHLSANQPDLKTTKVHSNLLGDLCSTGAGSRQI